jgi:hypothetical protein
MRYLFTASSVEKEENSKVLYSSFVLSPVLTPLIETV